MRGGRLIPAPPFRFPGLVILSSWISEDGLQPVALELVIQNQTLTVLSCITRAQVARRRHRTKRTLPVQVMIRARADPRKRRDGSYG